jgi:spermidine synthase
MWAERIHEYINSHECHSHEIVKIYKSGQTSIQSFQIVELGNYGRALVIDGRIQSTEEDEYIYHESLIYPVYSLHPELKRILCFGGANGGVLRELRKIPKLEAVRLIDIDPELCELSKVHLPHMHQSSYNDPRFTVHFGDPRKTMLMLEDKFDAVFADLPDAVTETNTSTLFTREFYFHIKHLLNDKGLFVTQAGAAHHRDCEFFASVLCTLKSVFRFIAPYSVSVPSYGIPWGFVIASDGIDPSVWDETDITRKLDALITNDLRAYDATAHCHMFSLSKTLREALNHSGRIIEDVNPACVSVNPKGESKISN